MLVDREADFCPMLMHDGRPCGRPAIERYPAVGGSPVCLMHSGNPTKSIKAFEEEVERILSESGESLADFTRFVFVGGRGGRRRIAAECVFQHATFLHDAHFARVVFEKGADFSAATFKRRAVFIGTIFKKDAHFSESLFEGEAHFARSRFQGATDFTGAEFRGPVKGRAARFDGPAHFVGARLGGLASFVEVIFSDEADFEAVVFLAVAEFTGASFHGKVSFHLCQFRKVVDLSWVHFGREASFAGTSFTLHADFTSAYFNVGDFSRATFTKGASFYGSQFGGLAYFAAAVFDDVVTFSNAQFDKKVTFSGAVFADLCDLCGAEFKDLAIFSGATFRGPAEFRETAFREDKTGLSGPVFSLARFECPKDVCFQKAYLGQAVFFNCDVSEVNFSNVRWARRSGNGKAMVHEERAFVEKAEIWEPSFGVTDGLAAPTDSADERNYVLIAELYQQLKKNYDDRRDYWTAGDFHYGEMEMKRLSSPHRNKLLRWWHRNLGLVGLYRAASEYGESYTRPVVWLAAVVVAFALLVYPSIGLRYSSAHSATSETVVKWLDRCPDSTSYHTCMGFWRLAGNSLLTSVEVAGFQRELAYEPVYPWGRVARLVEVVLTSTLLALFLLALRRQFRR
jgi:uncharacterized protein YjbI with pentapeptide repeats